MPSQRNGTGPLGFRVALTVPTLRRGLSAGPTGGAGPAPGSWHGPRCQPWLVVWSRRRNSERFWAI